MALTLGQRYTIAEWAVIGGKVIINPTAIRVTFSRRYEALSELDALPGCEFFLVAYRRGMRWSPPAPEAAKPTLRDVLPREATGGEYGPADRFWKHLDRAVIAEHDSFDNPQYWPGREKNVVAWWELEGGIAVGWNENMSRGWSFPVIRYPVKASPIQPAGAAQPAAVTDDKRTRVSFPKFGLQVACVWYTPHSAKPWGARLNGVVRNFTSESERTDWLRRETGSRGQAS